MYNPLTTLEFVPTVAAEFNISYGDNLQLLRLFNIKCPRLRITSITTDPNNTYKTKSAENAAQLLIDIQINGGTKKEKILKFQKGLIDLGLAHNAGF